MFLIGNLEGLPMNESNIEFPAHLYKVIAIDHWEKSKQEEGLFLTSADDAFIHLSEEHQLDGIIRKFFSASAEVVVLKIDVSMIEGRLVKEKNPGGENKYFHLYDGFIPFDSILQAEVIRSR
jgi:uncharacterized protein (DUF952 family)